MDARAEVQCAILTALQAGVVSPEEVLDLLVLACHEGDPERLARFTAAREQVWAAMQAPRRTTFAREKGKRESLAGWGGRS